MSEEGVIHCSTPPHSVTRKSFLLQEWTFFSAATTQQPMARPQTCSFTKTSLQQELNSAQLLQHMQSIATLLQFSLPPLNNIFAQFVCVNQA
jgi:hypothetical protein